MPPNTPSPVFLRSAFNPHDPSETWMEPAPKAKLAIVPGFEEFQFFAWRMDDPEQPLIKRNGEMIERASPRKYWCLCEAKTGGSIAHGDTLPAAIRWAEGVLSGYGAQRVARAIEEQVERQSEWEVR